MAELKQRIEDDIKSISKTTLSNVFANVLKRMNFVISVDGDHFEHLL